MKTSTKSPARARTRDQDQRSLTRIKSILVPLDFSPPSRRALIYAADLAEQFDARLTVMHAIEPVATLDVAAMVWEDDKRRDTATAAITQFLKAAHVPQRLVETSVVRFGRSFHEITDVARTRKVDLIVISTHGYTGVKRAILGSTTERVVRHAACPVLVLRRP
jgi:nucleotide-binding universal stress UspA family protein